MPPFLGGVGEGFLSIPFTIALKCFAYSKRNTLSLQIRAVFKHFVTL